MSQTDTPSAHPLAPVLLVNFIGTLGFSIVLPFIVFIVTRFGGNAFIYGLVEATYPVFQFFGAPMLGRWSDRFGRKRMLLLSALGTLAAWVIFCGALLLPTTELLRVQSAWVGDFTVTLPLLVLVGSRALDGLTGGNISIANAYVADISTDATRNRNFGRMAVAANLGMILGPALAGTLGATPWAETLPVLAATAISLVSVVLIAALLPEPGYCGLPSPTERDRAGGVFGQEPRDCMRAAATQPEPAREALRQPGVVFILALNFMILVAFNFFYTAFPIHVAVGLHWTVVDTGIFFSVLSLLLVIVEGPVLAWLSRRISEPPLVVVGCLALGANFALLVSSQGVLIYAAAALFALGNGIMWPSLESLTARTGGRRHQGVVQGLVGSAGSLAAVFGLITGGLVFAWVGVGTFLLSAALIALCAALALRLPRVMRAVQAAA